MTRRSTIYDTAIFALASIALAVNLHPVLKPGVTFGIFDDNTFLFAPLFHVLNEIVSSGEMPLWIKEVLGGMPFYNTPQLSFFYPFYFFWVEGLYATPLGTAEIFTRLSIAHNLLMIVNMAIFLRAMSLSWAASILGAFILALSACVAMYSAHVVIMASYSWIPLLLAGIQLIITGRGNISAVALTVFAASMVALASPSQTLIHAAILCIAQTIAAGIPVVRGASRYLILRRIGWLALAVLLTIAIVGPSLIPALLNGNEMRWLGANGSTIGRGAVPYSAFLEGQLSPNDLLRVFVSRPIAFGTGDNFVGFTAIALALFAFLNGRHRSAVITYTVLALYFLFSATGDNLGFAKINYHIPILNMIRQPARNLYLFVFAISILSAIGFDALRQLVIREYGIKRAVTVILFAVAIVCWTKEQPTRWYATVAQGDYATAENLRMHAILRLVSTMPNKGSRVRLITDGAEPGDERMRFSMDALWYGVRTFNVWLNPVPDYRTFQEFSDFGTKSVSVYRALGVRYIICTKCDGVEGSLVGEAGGYKLYRDDQAASYVQTDCINLTERQTLNRLTFANNCPKPSSIVISEIFTGEWKATLNGQPATVIRSEHGLVSVSLDAGVNIVDLYYYPRMFFWLLWISAVALLTWLVITAAAIRNIILDARLSRHNKPAFG
jgi:hypothetical protein